MKYIGIKKILLIVGDLILAVSSVYAAIYLRVLNDLSFVFQYPMINFKAIIFSLVMVFMCFFVDLYNEDNRGGMKLTFVKIFFAGALTSLALAALYYLIPEIVLWRSMLVIAVSLSCLLLFVWHLSYCFCMKLPVVANRVLILGTGPIAKTMGTILNYNNFGFALAGYVNCAGEPVHVPRKAIKDNDKGLLAIANKENVQKIVVSLAERRGNFPTREVLDCKLNGIDIIDGPFFYEKITGKLLIESMNPSHLIFSDGFRVTVFSRYLKRLVDMVIALIGIVLSMPVIVIVSILIKLESKGPILFEQSRLGEGEKTFNLLKFRTMIDGAEKDSGPVWSQAGDKRITKLGKLLRRSRIDEIPQLINVICGDMSFIGPRPERQFFVESLKKSIPYYSERHCVKPGITGWAQIKYEYGASREDAIEKLKYDLYYIKYQSISLDMLIFLDTIKVVIFGRGGR